MTLDAAGIQAIAAVGALMLAMITLIGGWTYWLVRDAERNLRTEMSFHREELRLYREEMDRLREDMREQLQRMREEMDRLREDMRRDMDRFREDMREEMDRLREDMREESARIRDDMQLIRDELRRNHREVLTLLEGHTHDAGGNAMFRRLPDAADS